MIANRFAGHRGYRVIQQISGVGPTFAAVFVAEIGDIEPVRPPGEAVLLGRADPAPPRVRHHGAPRADHEDGMWRPQPRPPFPRVGAERGEVVVPVVGGIDIHRAQLTFDYVDVDSGEVFRGRIAPADRAQLRQLAAAVRRAGGCGVCAGGVHRLALRRRGAAAGGDHGACRRAGRDRGRRGPKRRAKTDRSDAQLLRDLLIEGRIPESWIPPPPVLEARALVRLYKDLLDERTGWLQRVHASLFHAGAPDLDVTTMSAAGRQRIATVELSPATRTAVDVAMRQVDRLTEDMTRVREQITPSAAASPPAGRCRPRTTGSGR